MSPRLFAPALSAALAALVVSARPAAAQPRAHAVDKAHSEINFTASARMLDAHGYFGTWDADVQLDPQAMERSTVRLTIDATSINTRNERRDNHLRSADFFDVAKYPTITFASRSIARTSATTGVITGDLTMHGVTKPVQVPVTMRFYENGRGRFGGAFTVNRADFGVTGNSRLNPIENEVAVQFNLTLAEPRPAAGGAGR